MGMIARLMSGTAVVAMAMLALPAMASAAPPDGGLGLEIRTAESTYGQDEPVRLTFAVTNAAGAACGLAKVADGTVQVTSVRKDGAELAPVLGRSFYLDGIDSAIAAGVTAAEPGSTVDVALASVRVHDDAGPGSVVLRSVAVIPGGGGLDALWPIGAPGRYEVTATYAVPSVAAAVAPCAGVTAARTVTFTIGGGSGGSGIGTSSWLWVLAGALVVLVLGTAVIVLLVRRRHRAAGASVLLLISLGAVVGGSGKPAYASYEVDSTAGVPVSGVDFGGAVAACMAQFAAPGGDPAGILNRLNDSKTPKVRIIPTTGGSGSFETPASKDGKGSSTVTWNPTSVDAYGDGVGRDPCAALYHELNHSDDISRDAVPQGECGETGIKTAEVKATLAENKYRVSKGLPPRQEYDGKKLPKSMDDCKKSKKKKAPPAKGPVKLCEGAGANQCGSTNGDPHLVTFDRVYYDFQAVGEFVAVRSTSGDALEIQTRQAPLGSSRTVSVNSAVAFRLGKHTMSLVLVDGATQARIDGEPVVVAPGEKGLPGGGALVRRPSDLGMGDGYDVRWPDGSAAAVDPIGAYGYRLLAKLAPSRAGAVRGLLGNFDGDPANDIVPPSGAPLTQPVPFEKLYPSYSDSWRVAQKDSLFSYDGGQSTETFTDRSYPDRSMTVADLDDATRARAEAACRWAGVTDPWLFMECIFDVGVTGRSEFALSSAGTEVIAPPVAAPIAAKPIATGTLVAGTNDRLVFAGKAGGAVFIDIAAPTLADQCSPYRLLNPTGQEIASGCNINGVGFIDRTELKLDGDYTVMINARPGDTGRATMRVYAAADHTGTVELNGPPVLSTIEQPGSLARYRFTGKAGQRVFVEVPDSSLPDQCAPLELRDQAGTLLNTGCVINGFGEIDGTLLPADGTYTVVVDPRDRTIGALQLRLFAAKDQTSTITVNGPPVVATISQPGFVTQYQFSGTAGMSVSLTATDATLPDQCSPIELRDPTGRVLNTGCVINGMGDIDATVLPTTGTYAIVVDPRGTLTGTVTLSLRG